MVRGHVCNRSFHRIFLYMCRNTCHNKKCGDRKTGLKILAWAGVIFSLLFIVLQLVPIPGLEGVHFVWQSYVMLGIWIAIGIVFYVKQRKQFGLNEETINKEDVIVRD